MSDPVRFLYNLAHALAALSLYREEHPAREKALDAAFTELRRLIRDRGRAQFTFLGDEVVCGTEPLRQLKDWDWASRLVRAGIQRLEFDDSVTRDDFDEFLDEIYARLNAAAAGSADVRQMRGGSRIRWGAVGLQSEVEADLVEAQLDSVPPEFMFSLVEEADTLRWLHQQVQEQQQLHLAEAESVVRSLTVAMHADREMLIPLLHMRNFDEYTTTHAMNVAVLAMALTEYLGLGATDVRLFGVAGLLHDVGKVSIPREILVKRGKLTPDERRIINRHPAEGARIILRTQQHLELAALVAYEHHVMIDGGGYPTMHYRQECHYASRIVHVCDVYDALRTERPYRSAWDSERVLRYIRDKAGTEFDAKIAHAFLGMMRKWDSRVARVSEAGDIWGAEHQFSDWTVLDPVSTLR